MSRKPSVSSESVAQDQIRAFVERIMRMREEARAINDDIREIYAEAKGNGFDKTVLGKLVLYVEKRATKADELAEKDALFDLYLEAFDGRSSRTHAHEDTNPTPPASQETTAADPAEGVIASSTDHISDARKMVSADQSTAPRSDVGHNSTEASGHGQRLDPAAATTPPAGETPPVDTNSATHHGGSGAIPETAAAPVAEGVSHNASSVTPFLAITAGGRVIRHQGEVA